MDLARPFPPLKSIKKISFFWEFNFAVIRVTQDHSDITNECFIIFCSLHMIKLSNVPLFHLIPTVQHTRLLTYSLNSTDVQLMCTVQMCSCICAFRV